MMRRRKEFLECVAVLAVGTVVIALLSSIGSRHTFAFNVAYAALGLASVSVSFTAGMFGALAVCRRATGNEGESNVQMIVSALFGFVVAAPLGTAIVFRMAKAFMPRW